MRPEEASGQWPDSLQRLVVVEEFRGLITKKGGVLILI